MISSLALSCPSHWMNLCFTTHFNHYVLHYHRPRGYGTNRPWAKTMNPNRLFPSVSSFASGMWGFAWFVVLRWVTVPFVAQATPWLPGYCWVWITIKAPQSQNTISQRTLGRGVIHMQSRNMMRIMKGRNAPRIITEEYWKEEYFCITGQISVSMKMLRESFRYHKTHL